jgi:hypothetical protein
MRGTSYKPRDPSQIARESLARIDMVWSAAVGLSLTDWIRGASFQALNLLLSLQSGEPFRARRALLLEACHTAAAGAATARAEKLVEAALVGIEGGKFDDPYLEGWLHLARAYIAYFSGSWRIAFEGAERADAIFSANCTHAVWERNTSHALSHWAQCYLGSLKTLGHMLPARLHEAELQGNLYAVWSLSATISVLHWIARDDLEGGRKAVAQIANRWSPRGYQIQHWNDLASGTMLDLYAGDVAAARQRVEDGWKPMNKALLTQVQVIRCEINELQARTAIASAVACGEGHASERDRYLKIAEHHTKTLGKEGMAWTNAIAILRRAGVSAARGDRETAATELRAAVTACDGAELGMHAAAARLRLADLLGGDEGAALRAAGLAALVAEDVAKPEEFARVFAP